SYDHNYTNTFNCDAGDCLKSQCNADSPIDLPQNVDRSGWRIRRRIVEFGFLLEQLQYCCECRLAFDNVVGELKKGLGGYLYVRCQNHDCLAINRDPYGKTHRLKKRGMPCFAANTKLGTVLILTNLILVRDIAEEESVTAMKTMDNYVEYLGVGLLPDSSPSTSPMKHFATCEIPLMFMKKRLFFQISNRTHQHSFSREKSQSRKRLSVLFPCKTRHGMSCAVDTAWQKRGFDRLTSHTFFMSRAKYGKKVV
ncbi:hypothetical protein MAR_019068, partial [Mya arenaria]